MGNLAVSDEEPWMDFELISVVAPLFAGRICTFSPVPLVLCIVL